MLKRLPAILLLAICGIAPAQKQAVVWTDQEKIVADRIETLRDVPDDKRGGVTRELAAMIRRLPPAKNKMTLANGLADLSTEGDFGHATLQDVAETLDAALREQAAVSREGMPEEPYVELAQLIRNEHVDITDNSPLLNAAMARLQAEDQRRQKADFALTDLQGHQWTLKQLRGKVVLVNFWATWCPPCRKEMPYLDALYKRFRDRGLVILAISDEDVAKVKPFIAEKGVSYPVLLDSGSAVNKAFAVYGLPNSFVYDRDGNLVAQAIDMRTRGQFLEMLGKAGLK